MASIKDKPILNIHPTCLIERTSAQLNPGMGSAKVMMIADCINKYIQELLSQVGQDYPEFKVSELLQVGSFKEGTKIISPNEFDYLAVIESLSKPGCICVQKAKPTMERPVTAGLVEVMVAPEYMETWEKYYHEGYLRCFQMSGKNVNHNQHDTFGTIVVKTIAKMEKRKGIQTLRDQNLSLSVLTNCEQYHKSVLETKEIKIKLADVHHPNVQLSFLTEDYKISADLCPAIRYTKVEECFDEKLCASMEIAESVKKHGSVLLVGRLNCDFRITFTEIEVNYMQCELRKNHQMLYMYLKYINHLFVSKRKYDVFTSYMLKTVVIHHDIHCIAKDKSLYRCFGDIIDLLSQFVDKDYMPNIFNSDVNLLQPKPFEATNVVKTFQKIQLVILKDIHEMSKQEETVDQHKEDIWQIVKAAIEECDESLRPGYKKIPETFHTNRASVTR